MSKSNVEISFSQHRLSERIDLYLLGVGMGFNAATEKRRRLHDAYALDSLSDGQLAGLGLRRADIPAFVFADLLGSPPA